MKSLLRHAVVVASSLLATGCFDLDSFVMNPRHCSAGYSEELCAAKKLCTPCGEDLPFADFGIPAELATRHPIPLDDGEDNDAWFVRSASGGALADVTVVFSHGNFGGIEHYLNRIAQLWEVGVNVFAVDYRGFGHSSDPAEATEAQFMADARAARAFLPTVLAAEGLDPRRPVAMAGYSAGALSTVEMLVQPAGDGPAVCALLLEAPWPSVEAFTRDSTFVGVPGSFVTTGAWNNIDKLRHWDGPTLHFHGADDLTVREALGRELFDAIGSADKTFVSVPGAAHGNFIEGVDDDVARDVPAVLGRDFQTRIAGFLTGTCGQ
jgi:pimeloyl-ACP methyl ester carboxylesterase